MLAHVFWVKRYSLCPSCFIDSSIWKWRPLSHPSRSLLFGKGFPSPRGIFCEFPHTLDRIDRSTFGDLNFTAGPHGETEFTANCRVTWGPPSCHHSAPFSANLKFKWPGKCVFKLPVDFAENYREIFARNLHQTYWVKQFKSSRSTKITRRPFAND